MSDIKYESTKPLEEFKVVKEAKMRKTSGDLINREETYKVLTDYYHHKTEVQHKGLKDALDRVPSAEPNILDDGTLTITVPHGMLSKVNRVIVDEVGTKFCKMMYQDALPSAEHKGKWVNHRNDDGHNIADCNLCGSTLQWFDNDGEHNYCPNCGARMVSEDDT